MNQTRDLIQINDITEDEQTALIRLLQRHSEEQVRVDHERSVVIDALVAAFTWAISHPDEIKKALALADDLIQWIKTWRQRRAASSLPQQANTQAEGASASQPGRIIIVLAGRGPKDITSATDEEIRDYFRKNSEAL